jgi:hypothetical protein
MQIQKLKDVIMSETKKFPGSKTHSIERSFIYVLENLESYDLGELNEQQIYSAYDDLKLSIRGTEKILLPSLTLIEKIGEENSKIYHYVDKTGNHYLVTGIYSILIKYEDWNEFKDSLYVSYSKNNLLPPDVFKISIQELKRHHFICLLNRHTAKYSDKTTPVLDVALLIKNRIRWIKIKNADMFETFLKYPDMSV